MSFTSGWWFQTFFVFHNIWDNPSFWLICLKMVKITDQTCFISSFGWMASVLFLLVIDPICISRRPTLQFSCGYGSIPIHTIFNGMNIHVPAILMWTEGVQGFDPSPCDSKMPRWNQAHCRTHWVLEGLQLEWDPWPICISGKTLTGLPLTARCQKNSSDWKWKSINRINSYG